ncbi:MAG TPA: stage II sporulation protein M [Planctomycetaceae bacterium]|nr:stage II sporulation protein M [Planctomycetaceae bacterium]
MNRREWVKERAAAWRRFEHLVNQFERVRLKRRRAGEVAELSRLFRELANDLATIRSRGWGERLESYVNHLVARGHSVFYKAPPGGFANVAQFLAVDYPRLFRANFGYSGLAAVLFFGPLVAAWVVVQNDPSLGARVLDAELLEAAAAMYDYDPDDRSRPLFQEMRTAMGGFYVRNNVGIALRAFATGVLLGAFTAYVLLSNGIIIGTIAGYIIAEGHGRAFTSFVISHGSFELTAIVISGGAGLMLGNALLHPGQRTRLESLKVRGLEAVKVAAGAAVMLLIAAVLEAFWSPSGVPSALKYVVGSGLWVLVILYLALAGRQEVSLTAEAEPEIDTSGGEAASQP